MNSALNFTYIALTLKIKNLALVSRGVKKIGELAYWTGLDQTDVFGLMYNRSGTGTHS